MASSKVPSSLIRWGRLVAAGRASAKSKPAVRGDVAPAIRPGGSARETISAREAMVPRERPATRPRTGPSKIDARASEELGLVLREVADAMGARSAVLTMHPAGAERPIVLHAEEEQTLDAGMAEELLQGGHLAADGDQRHCAWATWQAEGAAQDVLMIAVDPVEGHSRLMISVIFDALSADERSAAEEVYRHRRPFAIGYFRLWQLERTRCYRITALQAALNLTEVGVLLVDRHGRLVFGNDAAGRILDAGDGLANRTQALRATNLREDIRLQAALGHVIGASLPGAEEPGERRAPIMSITRTKGPPLILSVLPTSEPASEPSDVAAIVYVLDPALDADQFLEPVCKLFHLTPVETKLVCQLAGGATLAEAAETMHVKELTARSCLKQVFLKTGTNRQADLVRVMLSNLARTTRTIRTEVI